MVNKKVSVIGLGRVGLPLSASIAEAGFEVTGIDINRKVIRSVNSGEPLFYEPGLKKLLKKNKQRIVATCDFSKIVNSDAIIVTVGTPNPSLKALKNALEKVAKNLRKNQLIIIKSTVPPGTTEGVAREILEQHSGLRASEDFYLAYCPERLVEGKALGELRSLPKIVGGLTDKATDRAAQIISKIGGEIIKVRSPKAAEAVKLLDNIYRYVNIALANEVGLWCKSLGLDPYEVTKIANKNYPRNKIMTPGPCGGPCLPKDSRLFVSIGESKGVECKLIKEASLVNNNINNYILKLVLEAFEEIGKQVVNSKVFIIGLSYKQGVDDVRGSPSRLLIEKLKKLKANVVGYDTVISRSQARQVGVPEVEMNEGFDGADCVVFMSHPLSLKDFDLSRYVAQMQRPAVIVDTSGMLKLPKGENLNIVYKAIR